MRVTDENGNELGFSKVGDVQKIPNHFCTGLFMINYYSLEMCSERNFSSCIFSNFYGCTWDE